MNTNADSVEDSSSSSPSLLPYAFTILFASQQERSRLHLTHLSEIQPLKVYIKLIYERGQLEKQVNPRNLQLKRLRRLAKYQCTSPINRCVAFKFVQNLKGIFKLQQQSCLSYEAYEQIQRLQFRLLTQESFKRTQAQLYVCSYSNG